MKKTADTHKKGAVLQLKGNLSIYEVTGIREELLAALAKQKSITVDLQQVEEWDVAGLQLLVSMRKSATDSGVSLSFANPPQQLCDTLPLLGLASDFISGKSEVGG